VGYSPVRGPIQKPSPMRPGISTGILADSTPKMKSSKTYSQLESPAFKATPSKKEYNFKARGDNKDSDTMSQISNYSKQVN
jgi:hypothetical protein